MSQNKHHLPLDQWVDQCQKFNWKCAYCGKDRHLTQDCFIPVSKGGKIEKNNVVPACAECNTKKGNKLWKIGCRVTPTLLKGEV